MARRLYWLKLKDDFFTQPKIKKLRKLAGGDTYTIIYLKMQLLSLENGGVIPFEGIEKTFAEELSLKIDEDPENIDVVIRFLISQGLMEEKDNDFLILEAAQNTGSESDSADRVRRFREKKAQERLQSAENGSIQALQCNAPETMSNESVTTEIRNKKEESKNRELRNNNTLARSRKNGSKPVANESPIFITLPLNTGEEWPVTEDNVKNWSQLYPAVDVEQQLRNMRGWLESNPAKRKTRNGVARFVTGWLSREQDRGGKVQTAIQQPAFQKKKSAFDLLGEMIAEDEEKERQARDGDYWEVTEND